MTAKKKTTKKEEYTKYFCEACGKTLSPSETRTYLEGVYAIDPQGDNRRLCSKCKGKL